VGVPRLGDIDKTHFPERLSLNSSKAFSELFLSAESVAMSVLLLSVFEIMRSFLISSRLVLRSLARVAFCCVLYSSYSCYQAR
jgi:hypothetical protein